MTERVTGAARRVPGSAPSWAWPAGLGAAAVACAVIVTVAGGPVRFVAGAVLALYLPGQLLVLALRRVIGRDGVFGAALVVPLSIAACAAVGLLLATGGLPFGSAAVACSLAALCSLLAAAASIAGDRGAAPIRLPRRPAMRHWWAALPALALTGLLAVQIVAAVRHPSPDPSYTEFALDPSGSVLVHSHERATTRFRYEVRVGDAVRQSAGFTLRPGERREFPLNVGADERADVRLYRGDEREPYRRLNP